DHRVFHRVARLVVPREPFVPVGDRANRMLCDVAQQVELAIRRDDRRRSARWCRCEVPRPLLLDDRIGHGGVLDGLHAKREEEGTVEPHRRPRYPGPQGQFWEPLGFHLQELTRERDIARVVAAENEFETAVRDEALAYVCLLRCGDDRFTVLAHFAGESCRHAHLAGPLTGEHIVAFIKDQDVLELLARRTRVLAQQQHGLQEEEAKEALLVVPESLQLKYDGASEEFFDAYTAGVQRTAKRSLAQFL